MFANGKKISDLKPEKRRYFSTNDIMTEAAIDSSFGDDLYIAMGEALDSGEQEVLMTLFYKEKKVRDVVSSLASMAQDQRQEVFQRLGLPQDVLSRLPPPDASASTDLEVEWEEWKPS